MPTPAAPLVHRDRRDYAEEHTNPENGSAPDDCSCTASKAANEPLRSGGYPFGWLSGGHFVNMNAGVFRHPCDLSRTLYL